jgi:hypothetical protein
MSFMHYSYTLPVYNFEKHHKGYLNFQKIPCFHLELDQALSKFIIDEMLIRVGSDWVWLLGCY